MDPICCICVSDSNLLVARDSGLVHRYSLPQVSLQKKYSLAARPQRMAMNCTDTRLASISHAGNLILFDLDGNGKIVDGFERRDIWDIKWDQDSENMLAIMEKTRLYVLRGTEAEDPIVTSGYICQFKDLTVRTALLDDLVANPEHPQKDLMMDMEIKSLRDAKVLLEKMSLQDAAKFIDQNPHAKLWSLLAEVALNQMDIEMAEHAFVHLKDYAGIQFVKKVNNIQNEVLRKAEVAAYFNRFDEAEKMYLSSDRGDLAIALRKKLGDWFRVVQLLQSTSGPDNDRELEQAWNAIGEYYASRHRWQQAMQYYTQGKNYEGLVMCYYMTEDYNALEQLAVQLPDNHELLPKVGEIFANAGMSEEAVEAYLKSDDVKAALDLCIQLNQWEKAMHLARKYEIPDVENLVSKYAQELIADPERQLTAVQLYRKAGRFLEAAKLVFNLAEEQKEKGSTPLKLKKVYVLGALLVEQHHQHAKEKLAAQQDRDGKKFEAHAALTSLLDSEGGSIMDTRLIDNAWRGAEAYHFYMLAQRQLYEGNIDGAMKTALHLTEYDDILPIAHVYAVLALASCANRQFSVCSKAFIKLESLENISDEEREAFANLALDIFTANAPKDSRSTKAECTGCDTLIPDYCQACPSCNTKFPTCIVTGRPLMDYQFWLCPICKHRAYEQEIATMRYCPLCHASL